MLPDYLPLNNLFQSLLPEYQYRLLSRNNNSALILTVISVDLSFAVSSLFYLVAVAVVSINHLFKS